MFSWLTEVCKCWSLEIGEICSRELSSLASVTVQLLRSCETECHHRFLSLLPCPSCFYVTVGCHHFIPIISVNHCVSVLRVPDKMTESLAACERCEGSPATDAFLLRSYTHLGGLVTWKGGRTDRRHAPGEDLSLRQFHWFLLLFIIKYRGNSTTPIMYCLQDFFIKISYQYSWFRWK